MTIDYNHSADIHTLAGPKAAFPKLFPNKKPLSLLDVGCGVGTWLRAALDFGIQDVLGVDGVEMPEDKLHVPTEVIRHQDLTRPWDLNRRFDAIVCFEVAEHLDSAFAPLLIDTLAKHSDLIFFAAACPGQPGQHHVNCRWPNYWQRLFNDRGYACNDGVRWQIWEIGSLDPWYRQNMFAAQRADQQAGKEPRIHAVIHPQMRSTFQSVKEDEMFCAHVRQIKDGRMRMGWYLKLPFQAVCAKLMRKVQ